MKKVLFMAFAAMLVLAGCGEKKAAGTEATAENGAQDAKVEAVISSQIAYVNLDSLMAGYGLFVDSGAELEKKSAKAEADLAGQTRSLEKAFADAQDKIEKGLVTRSQAQQLQEDLQKREQNLYQTRERMLGELGEENQVLMNNIFNNIDVFLKEFNDDYRYGMILTTTGAAGPVLNADPRLNITDIVLRGLNEKYKAEQDAKAKQKK